MVDALRRARTGSEKKRQRRLDDIERAGQVRSGVVRRAQRAVACAHPFFAANTIAGAVRVGELGEECARVIAQPFNGPGDVVSRLAIVADAVGFCRLAANRVTPAELGPHITGDEGRAISVLTAASTLALD